MNPMGFYSLLLFFSVLYTSGLWARLGVPDLVLEAALVTLPFVVLRYQPAVLRRLAPGFLFVWFYLGWSICACLYHGEGFARGLLYSRFLVGTYVVFWAVWNSHFTAWQLLGINRLIIGLFLLQVAAALFYWLVLGRITESIVGTLGHESGAIATCFSMFAFSCLLAFFLYYNRLIFLVAAFSFFVVGYASGKLAIYYFLPTMLVLGLVFYAAVEGLPKAVQRASLAALVACGALPFVIYLLTHTSRTERLQEERGTYGIIESFLDYTQARALESRTWYTTTRVDTSKRVIQETFRRNPSVFLLGQGTRVLLEASGQATEGAYDEYGIIYGLVGWSNDALAVGWPAMIAHSGFYIYLYCLLHKKKRNLSLHTYWKAILLTVELGFCVFLITYFLYSRTFTIRGWISTVYLYFLAVLLAPQYEPILSLSPAMSRSAPETPTPVRSPARRGAEVRDANG